MNQETSAQTEPYFYIALVLRGSEKQYLDLMEYLKNQNSTKIIYQRKALTYLRIVADDGRLASETKVMEPRGVTQ